MKFCKACGETKPLTEFYVDKARTDGVGFYCKPCTKTKNAQYLLNPKKPPRIPASPGMKRCQGCKEEKLPTEFANSSGTADGLDRRCKKCNYESHRAWREKNMEKAAADQRRWRTENPERARDSGRKTLYGVPIGWFATTLAAQEGKCACCGTSTPTGKNGFHIDHCHTTGKVRGILCGHCNLAMGHLRNDPVIAEAAKQYLLKHQTREDEPALPS